MVFSILKSSQKLGKSAIQLPDHKNESLKFCNIFAQYLNFAWHDIYHTQLIMVFEAPRVCILTQNVCKQ